MGSKMVPKRGPKSDQKMVHKIIPNGPKNCQDCYPVLLACYPISYFGATLPHFFQKMQFRVGHPTKIALTAGAPARGANSKKRLLRRCPQDGFKIAQDSLKTFPK